MEIIPKKKKWLDFFENIIYENLFSWLAETADFVDSEGNETILWNLPLTLTESSTHCFLWEHSKFMITVVILLVMVSSKQYLYPI